MTRVSVIIPALNEAQNLASCLPRVKSQLSATDELIVVDNGSSDATASIAQAKGAKVVFESRRGRAIARNAGISAAQSDLIAFVDADCLPNPDWLVQLTKPFEDPAVGCVAGEILLLNDTMSPLGVYLKEKQYLSQVVNFEHSFLPFGATGNVAFRRELLEQIGGFDETLKDGEDADLCWRMQLQTSLKIILAPSSIVHHTAPRSLRDLFRQKFRHARAAVALYKKYRSQWKAAAPSPKRVYWEYSSILRRSIHYLWGSLASRFQLGKPPLAAHGFQLSLELGDKLGRLSGSIRHHIWYP